MTVQRFEFEACQCELGLHVERVPVVDGNYVCFHNYEALREVLDVMTAFYTDMRLKHVNDYSTDVRRETMALIQRARDLAKS